MKLKKLLINYDQQTVTCWCELTVQGSPVIVPFTIPESALYDAASSRGKETWENQDVCFVGSQIVGQEVTL